jgi:hypothetical protein
MAEIKSSWERGNSVDDGCAYVLSEANGHRTCGAPRRRASSYCPRHHAVCYISSGTNAEVERLREVEALASAVGGRRGQRQRQAEPSRQFLRRLEQAVRGFSWPKCSLYVL